METYKRIEGNWNFLHLFNWQLVFALVLFAIANHLDWFLQSYQHVWPCYVDLHGRAAVMPWYMDWFPRDTWHAVQGIRNVVWSCVAPISAMMGLGVAYSKGWAWKISNGLLPRTTNIGLLNNLYRVGWLAWNALLVYALYWTGRGIGFSLFVGVFGRGI